jgi:hypothetical protein
MAISAPVAGSPESMRMPVQPASQSGAFEEALGAVGVGQDDAQVAGMLLVPVGQHVIGRAGEVRVGLGQRGVDHGQFVGVGADGLKVAVLGDEAVGGAGEGVAQPLLHGLHGPVLPEEGVAAAGAEIGDAQVGDLLEALDLFPELRHGAGVEDLKLEPAHVAQHGAAAQLHQDGERGDFPQHDLGPGAFEGQLVLIADAFEVVGRQLQRLEPVHEFGREHLALAVEGVAAHPGAFAPAEAERADMVQLLAQFALVDQVGERDAGCG